MIFSKHLGVKEYLGFFGELLDPDVNQAYQ